MQAILMAAVFVAFSWPSLATDYYYDATSGNDANDCSDGTTNACQTIGDLNGQNLGANDNVFLKCGETWTDATLTLVAGDSGTAGNPVTFQTYGTCGADPIISGTAFSRAANIDTVSYVTFDNIDFQGSENNSAGDHVVRVKGSDNLIFQNGAVRFMDNLGSGIFNDCLHLAAGVASTAITIDNMRFEDCEEALVEINDGTNNVTIKFSTFDGGSREGDMIIVNNCTGCNNLLVQDTTFHDPILSANAENAIDIKSGNGHIIERITTTACEETCLFFHEGNGTGTATVVILRDSDASNSNQAIMTIDNGANVTIERTNFHDGGGAFILRFGLDADGNDLNATIEASAFQVETGKGATELFDLLRGTVTLTNITAIMRNGAGAGLNLIDIGANNTGTLDINNSIFAGDSVALVNENAGSTAVMTGWTNNLWDGDAAPTTILALQTEGNLDADDVGVTAPVDNDTFGDPLFSNEDDTTDLYLMLGPGSPGIGLGDAASLYGGATSTDLLGYPFRNLTPNAGARAHRFRAKWHHRNRR